MVAGPSGESVRIDFIDESMCVSSRLSVEDGWRLSADGAQPVRQQSLTLVGDGLFKDRACQACGSL